MITGETHNLSDYAGKVVLLIFSGPSWCPPCIFEAPILQDLWEEFEGAALPGVQFLMVSCFSNETPNQFKTAIENLGITFPGLLNPGMSISNLYEANAVPTLFVINTQQKICNIKIGALPPADQLRQHIKDMLIECGAGKQIKIDASKWVAVMTILFGVTNDGGGFGFTPGGKPIPIDPWGPLRLSKAKHDMYTNLAIAELTGLLADYKTAKDIKSIALKSAEASMRKLTALGTMKTPDLKSAFEINPKKK